MATPNYEAEANTQVDKSWSHTHAKLSKLCHTWTIDNFRFLQEEKVLKSPTFSAEGSGGLTWHLELWPQGCDEESKGYISLRLYLDSCDKSDVLGNMKLSIVNTKQEEIKTELEEKAQKFVRGDFRGWPKFVERDRLLNNLKEISSDKFEVRCEVSVATSTVNLPSQKTPIKAQVPK